MKNWTIFQYRCLKHKQWRLNQNIEWSFALKWNVNIIFIFARQSLKFTFRLSRSPWEQFICEGTWKVPKRLLGFPQCRRKRRGLLSSHAAQWICRLVKMYLANKGLSHGCLAIFCRRWMEEVRTTHQILRRKGRAVCRGLKTFRQQIKGQMLLLLLLPPRLVAASNLHSAQSFWSAVGASERRTNFSNRTLAPRGLQPDLRRMHDVRRR